MSLRNLICRLLARFGIYPRGCPPKAAIGADKVTITLKQKDRRL